jgi:hypothetical protein
MKRLERETDPDWSRVFTVAERRDLQAWFQLAYIDESYKESDPRIIALARQGRDFSESDKATLGAVEAEILARIIPEYKRLQDSGQVELCTSPFYHPILPLLLDPQAGREANPRLAPYDLDFDWEEDAWDQLQDGLALMQRLFGSRPRGIWPPEGSLSEPVLRLLAKAGVSWTASDEEVLSRSLPRPLQRDDRFLAMDPAAHYSPYSFAGLPLRLFFRDHLLSDLIGFYYQKFPAREAAVDLHGRIKAIAASGPAGMTIPIILDGENAWEFYPHSGRGFLREFYRLVSSDPDIETVTFSEAGAGPARELPRLKCGSWINGNFDIWIGDRDDQRAWELLKEARDAFQAARAGLDPERAQQIVALLHATEGSDWFWWYGKENFTPDLGVFDSLFRLNLQKVYELLGAAAPDALRSPIPAAAPDDRMPVAPPRAAVAARIDGEASDYFEWLDAGRVDILSYGGAMNIASPLVKTLFFGFADGHVYLRIDTKKHARTYFENGFGLRVRLQQAARTWEGELGFAAGAVAVSGFNNGAAAVGRIIELKVPLAALAADAGSELRLRMDWSFNGQPFQAIPARGPLTLRVATEKDYAAYWQV